MQLIDQKNYPRRSGSEYTQEEDKLIIKEIEKSPDNLVRAFENIARILPARTKNAVTYRWYSVLKKKHNGTLATVSTDKITDNVKNDVRFKAQHGMVQIPVTLGFAQSVVSQLSAEERLKLFSNYIQ